MPELPEVETTRVSLLRRVSDQPKLIKIDFFREDLRSKFPKALALRAVGQRLKGVVRRAKYLIFEFEEVAFITHLGMTGTWRASNLELKVHDHIRMEFSSGVVLIYNDPRRFGYFDATQKGQPWSEHAKLQNLGPEPLLSEFAPEYLSQQMKKRILPIKALIMDQRVVVGVGNIYASEALFKAGIRPTRQAKSLKKEEIERLVSEVKVVLRKSIELGGSSISDFHDGDGKDGYFQNSFSVYNRVGQPCLNCGKKIKSKIIVGRNTFWCPRCQS